MARYHSKYLRFNASYLTQDNIDNLCSCNLDIKDFICLKPSGTADSNTYACYATRKHGKHFDLPKGAITLAKKLKCKPDHLSLIHVTHSQTMPGSFFDLLDPDNIEAQVHFALGPYNNVAAIRAKMDQDLTPLKKYGAMDKRGVVRRPKQGIETRRRLKAAEPTGEATIDNEGNETVVRLAEDAPGAEKCVTITIKWK